MTRMIALPAEVRAMLDLTASLRAKAPGLTFPLDGHLVGDLGAFIAREAFGLTLLANSHPAHDAIDGDGRFVQIKLVGAAAQAISLYQDCDNLLVMRLMPDGAHAEVVYNGPGAPVCAMAGAKQKNGQRKVSLSRIRKLAA